MSKELKKTKEEQELAGRVTAFCLASAALRELRQKLFPYGSVWTYDLQGVSLVVEAKGDA